jgi:hypothetical protein
MTEVNRHITKCFDNLKSLIAKDEIGSDPEVIALLSHEGEQLTLKTPSKLREFKEGKI